MNSLIWYCKSKFESVNNQNNWELEAKLELIALRFLNIVGEDEKFEESVDLADELINQIMININDVFKNIPSTGNFGIALHSILSNKIISEPSKKIIVRLISYWAISNHLKQDDIPLLRYNRAIGLYSDRSIFYELYKKTITGNMFTPDYQIEMSTAENTVDMLFMFDLFLIKDHSAHFNDVFKDLNKEFGTPMFGFNSNNYYIETHDKLMSLIKSKFIKMD